MQNSDQLPRIAIFVDVQNIYYTTRDTFQQQFNYRAFWQEISQQGDIVLANAYAIQRSDDQQHKFQKALKHIGFDVKLKPFIQRRDGSAKGDWDVGIAIDVMEAAAEVDIVILLSGDGDFDLLLKKIMLRDGVKTHVYGVTALTAQSLINAASEFFPIDRKLLL
ncbi:NYN domain-containing protein [Colwellia sp. MB02u-9]|uniref:NYN domain-containing protein n=1 Tax=Colwellia sp. MB02u-9 TaxID=2759823 RepID=UPI0015F701A4|nr:NYN domain-containing protein [Colwellia sp. MB02u-9]MBA6295946.1 NYN domain-containing protein [Colwellia sp. MB02u-9]